VSPFGIDVASAETDARRVDGGVGFNRPAIDKLLGL
jgi:hypothetical protein